MSLSAARYTRLVFPARAYRPGASPRPVTGPAPAKPADPARWRGSPEYLYGCDLYNHGYWWEAHEAWEALWHAAEKDSPQERFLKGLIQAAACALKVESDNRKGARTLLVRSLSHLSEARARLAAPFFMGLDLDRWRGALRVYYERLLMQPGALVHDPKRYPYIVLEGPAP